MRFLILTTHYRAPVQFTEETISSTQNELLKISKTYSQLAVALQVNGGSLDKKDVDITNFLSFLADDFNTANALTELFGAIKTANMDLRKNPLDISALERDFGTIKTMIDIFGLDIKYPHLSEQDIDLYNKYLEFKRNKQFDESDKIRAQLIEKNII